MGLATETADYGNGGCKVVVVCAILLLMQFFLVSGRYFSRKLQKLLLEADDYVLLLAAVSTFVLCAIAITFPRIAAVGQGIQYSETPPQAKLVGSTYIAWMVLYGISVSFSKCAILLLYIRVFTTRSRIFTIVIFTVGAVVVANGLATAFGSIFQYKIKLARFTALPNVITGFAMLLIPMPLVWQLSITVQQKIALTATFLHGIIGFVASLARLIILSQPAKTNSISWIAISWTIWTVVEPANYVIAACLPTLRPILVRVLPPSFFILTYQRTRKNYSSFKISWPKGRRAPKISLASKDIHGASHITGPWDSSRAYWEQDIEATDPKSPKSAGLETASEKTLEVSRSPTLLG